jgi:hypothetical protein
MELHAQIACRLPDKVEIIEVGPMPELVYYRACLRCREYLTDGVIARAHLTRWFAGIAHPAKHLARLVAVGMLEEHPDGWQFPDDVWRKWIPTKASVQAKREAEAERLRAYREQKRSEREAYDERTRVQGTYVRDAYKQPEPEPEPEPEPLARAIYKSSLDSYDAPDGELGEVIKGLFQRTEDVA